MSYSQYLLNLNIQDCKLLDNYCKKQINKNISTKKNNNISSKMRYANAVKNIRAAASFSCKNQNN